MIELPWPPKELNPNNNAHKRKKAAVKSGHRKDCYLLATQDRPHLSAPVHIKLTFFPPDARHRDLDNMLSACKGLIDGVADAWGIDDRNFRPITIDVGRPVKDGKVVVEAL